MKIFLLLSLMCLFSLGEINSQNKQDYYWPFGKDQNIEEPDVQAVEIDFNKRPLGAGVRNGGLSFDQNNASVCDGEGNLLFYTNGCAVANRFHEQMPDGDSINRGFYFDERWFGDCDFGYPGSQDIIILSDPGDTSGYYILHKPTTYNPDSSAVISRDSLHYSYVDMTLDEGKGDLTQKNFNFFKGDMLFKYLTAIYHSNGIDWWVLNPMRAGGYATFLIDGQGIQSKGIQRTDITFLRNTSSAGFARFSPDGTRYAQYNEVQGLHLFDFDRETGELNNLQLLPLADEDPSFATLEWSASSQYLYLMTSDTIWQLDTKAQSLESGLVFIEERDPESEGGFFQHAILGPDCRIYIRANSSKRYFHVIHKPDEKGTACDFQLDAIALPTHSASGSFPNFPRFRVDEEEKCDPSIVSIVGETVWWRRDLTVYPSPTTGPVTVEIPESKRGQLYVVDMQGQVVISKEVEVLTGELELSLDGLPAGMYSVEFVAAENEDRVVWTRKVSVVR